MPISNVRLELKRPVAGPRHVTATRGNLGKPSIILIPPIRLNSKRF
jgi:hypothetical protein